MRAISTTETDRMKATVAESFNDTCQLGTITVTHGSVYETESFSYGSTISCGFKAGGGKETADGSQTAINSGVLRLPLTTSITSTARVKLLSRFGYTLGIPMIFKVLGAPEYGPTAITLQLQAIPTTGSG
jgi:hypothetical protein